MRTILIFIYLIIYYIISLPLFVVGWLLGLKDPDLKHRFAQKWVCFGFRSLLFIGGIKVTVLGKENILDGQAALYVFNHRSFFDIIVGYVTGPSLNLFVAKDSLAHIPLISRWMRYMHCLFLDRKDIKKGMQTIKDGIELLKTGHSVFIAPEGTRSKTKKMLPFKAGSFRLADKSGCPIVPVAMNNMDECFENHLPWVKRTHVVIEYLEPIDMAGMEKSEKKKIGDLIHDIIEKKVEENEEKYLNT